MHHILTKTRKHAVAAFALVLTAMACNDEMTEPPPVEPFGIGTHALAAAAGDRAVLVAFYKATNGPDWDESDNWLTDAPLNAWHGVETDGNNGRVVILDLTSNNLEGKIPPELGNLIALRHLRLASNKLYGGIPPELGNLHNLESMNLSNAGSNYWGNGGLTGEIPPELSNLVNLYWLWIDRNDLTGEIPPELSNLVSLTLLDLAGNRLSGGLPPALADIPELQWLLWNDNASLCAPGTQQFIDFVKGLQVSDDGPFCHEADAEVLRSLHRSTDGSAWTHTAGWLQAGPLGDWHGVETDTAFGRVVGLNLQENELVGRFPGKLASLDSLRDLRLDGNASLEGRLPLGMTTLPLQTLSYEGTAVCTPADPAFRSWLDSIPSHAGTAIDCPPLTDRNVLEVLFDVTEGQNWINSDNWLADAPLNAWHGVETDENGRVRSLVLTRNNLAGEFPPELGNLTNLRSLDLSDNDLTGEIPPELGDLASLESLDVSFNALTAIPPELGDLTNLLTLDLSGNDLTGEIPPELGDLASLESLDVSFNALTAIPPELGNLANLFYLALHDNDLTGEIPPELGNLANLFYLALHDNDLTGEIPPELGNLANLFYLFLRNNDLTGEIPPELGNLANLQVLDMNGNDLTGEIPPELGNLANLRYLFLRNNDLTGEIPPELGNLTNLLTLYLSGNDLTGEIPPELGNLANLRSLSLHDNDLTGEIPPELGNLANLQVLDMNGNSDLSGALPHSFAKLRQLQAITLGGTALCAPDDLAIRLWLRSMSLSPNWNQYVAICKAQETAATATAYIVQGVQSANVPVPLVAGKRGLLRVLVTAPDADGARVPTGWATFYQPDGASTNVQLRSGEGTIPAEFEVAEGSLLRSSYVGIPGTVLRPGVEMVIVLDPEGALDPALGVPRRIPATGRTALDVYEMPSFDVTVVPFLQQSAPDSSVLDLTSGLTADAPVFDFTRLLPIGEMSVTVHEPVLTSTYNIFDLVGETEAIRVMEGGTNYYMGTGLAVGALGVAYIKGRSTFNATLGLSTGRRILVPETIAHEFGHNLSLPHAPCGTSGPPGYPHSNGRIGVWGYDHRSRSLVSPRSQDIMSYCGPRPMFSDYFFAKAFWWRLSVEAGVAKEWGLTRALLLWGGTGTDGRPFLNPAFVVEAPPTPLDRTGAWQIAGEAEDGRVLFTRRFEMAEIADGDGRQSFALALPTEAGWADALARIVLTGPDGEVTMDAQSGPAAALLRDPATGRVRGILRDWPDPVTTQADAAAALPEPGLEVQVSRGIPAPDAWRR